MKIKLLPMIGLLVSIAGAICCGGMIMSGGLTVDADATVLIPNMDSNNTLQNNMLAGAELLGDVSIAGTIACNITNRIDGEATWLLIVCAPTGFVAMSETVTNIATGTNTITITKSVPISITSDSYPDYTNVTWEAITRWSSAVLAGTNDLSNLQVLCVSSSPVNENNRRFYLIGNTKNLILHYGTTPAPVLSRMKFNLF